MTSYSDCSQSLRQFSIVQSGRLFKILFVKFLSPHFACDSQKFFDCKFCDVYNMHTNIILIFNEVQLF